MKTGKRPGANLVGLALVLCVGAALPTACGDSGLGKRTVTLDLPKNLLTADGSEIEVTVVAIEADGKTEGTGIVVLSADAGEFNGERGTVLPLAGGRAKTIFSCDLSKDSKCRGTIEIRASWKNSAASSQVTLVYADAADAGTVVTPTGRWQKTASPTTEHLNGVWGNSPNDVWIVGNTGTILHWEGTSWSKVTSPTMAHLADLWGSSANDVWAVGYGGTILHWQGSSWSKVPATGDDLFGVWGSSANDVWAVGSAGILHWQGSSWSKVPSPSTGSTYGGVWGSGADNVWVVSTAGALHWQGSSWSGVSGPNMTNLFRLWGSAANDLWAVGSGQIAPMHWDGQSWAPVRTNPTATLLADVWGSSATDVWAVGLDGAIVHWQGSDWWRVTSPTTVILQGVWGSSSSDVWAVGGSGTILHYR